MKSEDLRAWQKHLGLTYEQAALKLGVKRPTYAKYASPKYLEEIPRWMELGCAAVAAGLHTWANPGKQNQEQGKVIEINADEVEVLTIFRSKDA